MADYTAKRIDEMEAAFLGAFKRARAELGVESFGMQVMDLPARLEQYPEHDHAESGQEEVYFVVEGSGVMRVDGEEVDLRPGLSVAVVGSGTLGLLAVALLSRVSPERLALVGTRAPRLEIGRAMGATETWNVREAGAPAPGFDLVFEAAGTREGAATAISLARRGGTVVLEGIPGEAGGVDADTVVLGHLRVQGVFGASRNAWRWVTELFAAGLLDTAPLVSHSFALEQHAEAFAALGDRAGNALKVQLRPA